MIHVTINADSGLVFVFASTTLLSDCFTFILVLWVDKNQSSTYPLMKVDINYKVRASLALRFLHLPQYYVTARFFTLDLWVEKSQSSTFPHMKVNTNYKVTSNLVFLSSHLPHYYLTAPRFILALESKNKKLIFNLFHSWKLIQSTNLHQAH